MKSLLDQNHEMVIGRVSSPGNEEAKKRLLEGIYRAHGNDEIAPEDFQRLLGYWGELFLVESSLPSGSRMGPLLAKEINTAQEVDNVGFVIREVREAVEKEIRSQGDPAAVYFEMYDSLIRCLKQDQGIVKGKIKVFKEVPRVLYEEVPEEMFADETMVDEAIKALREIEVKELEKSCEEELAIQLDLDKSRGEAKKRLFDIAAKHRSLGSVAELLDFKEESHREYVVDNLERFLEKDYDDLLIGVLENIPSIRSDYSKLDLILRKILIGKKSTAFALNAELKADRKFIDYYISFILDNIQNIGDFIVIVNAVNICRSEEEAKRIMEEMVNRKMWGHIAEKRVVSKNPKYRHLAAQILEENIDSIDERHDQRARASSIEGDDDGVRSVFAIIGAIGLSKEARLKVIEKMESVARNLYGEGDPLGVAFMENPLAILKKIAEHSVTGANAAKYKDSEVEEAARMALERLSALKGRGE